MTNGALCRLSCCSRPDPDSRVLINDPRFCPYNCRARAGRPSLPTELHASTYPALLSPPQIHVNYRQRSATNQPSQSVAKGVTAASRRVCPTIHSDLVINDIQSLENARASNRLRAPKRPQTCGSGTRDKLLLNCISFTCYSIVTSRVEVCAISAPRIFLLVSLHLLGLATACVLAKSEDLSECRLHHLVRF